MENTLLDVSGIAQVIQIAVAPVFLLAGISGLLTVMTSRLARVIDRSRILQRGMSRLEEPESQALINKELKRLSQRGNFINIAINLATCSALLNCLVIMTLFLGVLVKYQIATTIAVLFIVCMAALIIALSLFLAEVFLATHAMRKGLMRTESLVLSLRWKGDTE